MISLFEFKIEKWNNIITYAVLTYYVLMLFVLTSIYLLRYVFYSRSTILLFDICLPGNYKKKKNKYCVVLKL